MSSARALALLVNTIATALQASVAVEQRHAGSDPAARVLAGPPQGDGQTPPLVLFDSVPRGWTAERWQSNQQEVLRSMADPGRLARVPVGVRSVLCQELSVLDRRLSAAAEAAGAPARQQQARELLEAMADAFDPSQTVHCSR